MKQIVFFDTSYGTLNLGDFIIVDAIQREFSDLISSTHNVHLSTHAPLATNLQCVCNCRVKKVCGAADYKFICGTNILKNSLLRVDSDWRLNPFTAPLYRGAVLVGCGRALNSRYIDPYTKALYMKVLSKDYAHSTRDDRTAELLHSWGLKAIVTGCPTTWGLDQRAVGETYSRCKIPGKQPDSALFTLTDYAEDSRIDLKIIDVLRERYRRILFWPQGSGDYEYAKRIGLLDKVELVAPSFEAYKAVMSVPFDYVGTRLHGGVYALSHGHRTVIIAVDHRAKDMAKTSGIPVVARGDSSSLANALDFERAPELRIPFKEIREWKNQFSA